MVDWRRFLQLASRHIQAHDQWRAMRGAKVTRVRRTSHCAFTTFEALEFDCHYWRHELPTEGEIGKTSILDGGDNWGQPFRYEDIAHFMIPRTFIEEIRGQKYDMVEHTQDVASLSELMKQEDIPHTLNDYVLEIKLF